MFNWIVSDAKQYLEPFNFVDLRLQILYFIYMYNMYIFGNK